MLTKVSPQSNLHDEAQKMGRGSGGGGGGGIRGGGPSIAKARNPQAWQPGEGQAVGHMGGTQCGDSRCVAHRVNTIERFPFQEGHSSVPAEQGLQR